jgi:hypothetical protein
VSQRAGDPTPSPREKMVAIIERAYADSSFRGKIIYFPERVIAEYELPSTEAYVVRTGDLTKVDLPEELLDRARYVWDTSHMSSGE